MKRLRWYYLHPILFAIYPVLTLLASNIEEASLAQALRAFALSLAAAILLFALLRLVLRDWARAALITSLFLLLFFSYGHVYNYLEQVSLFGFSLGRHRYLAPLWGLIFVCASTRKFKELTRLSQAFTLAGACLLGLALVGIGSYAARSARLAAAQAGTERLSFPVTAAPSSQLPDIYYIILDGYSRDDILEKFYQIDNRPFIDSLTQMGFDVARCSQSNYAQTQLSLASSLNANYLDVLGEQYIPKNTSRVGLPELIQDNATRRALESLGYRTIAFETGFEATQMEDVDEYLSAHVNFGMNDFEDILVRTTAGRILAEGIATLNLRPNWEARDQAQRERILYTLEQLSALPGEPGPKFVFAHIVAPHWPHVFGPNGEAVHERSDSATGYRNQVIFVNKKILPILQAIISRSAAPPVIIVQGDHGAVIESPDQRMSILNAYFLPGDEHPDIPENISPVNTFRLVLNTYFDSGMPLLENVAYYSTYEQPYQYQGVANKRRGCDNMP